MRATSPDENPKWTAWLVENAKPIRSLTHDADMSDLAFLDSLVQEPVLQIGKQVHCLLSFH